MSDETPFEIIVKNGEGQSGVPASMSVLQAIYHEITGKTETISKDFDDSYGIGWRDLEQLKHRVSQTLEQYDTVGTTTTITVRFTDSSEKRFSSWLKFEQNLDIGNTEPVLHIILSFEFLIALPRVTDELQEKKLHRYKLNVRCISKTGELSSRSRKNRIFRIYPDREPTITTTIEYVDHVIAWTFMSGVSDWVDRLDIIKGQYNYPFLKRWSFKLLDSIQLASFILVLFPAWYLLESFAGRELNLENFGIWMLCSIGIGLSLVILLRILFDRLQDQILSTANISCVRINKGDERVFQERFKKNKNAILAASVYLFGIVFSCIVTALSQPIVERLLNWITS